MQEEMEANIPPTQAQIEAVAVNMGLPKDIPFHTLRAIEAFFNSKSVKTGKKKGSAEATEAAKAAEEAIIAWMKSKGIPFLQLKEQYLVISDEIKPISLTDEVHQKSYVAFHRENRHNVAGSIENASVEFSKYCKEVCKMSGARCEVLKVTKKRPYVATISMLQRMGPL